MMKVVVAGGSGFLGQKLVAELGRGGHAVSVLARDVDAAKKRLGEGVKVLRWELDEGPAREAWKEEVKAASGVVNLAGAGVMDQPWTEARRRELVDSRILVTRALAETLATAPAPELRAFVSGSAVGYYGERLDDAVVTESSAPGTDFLADLCVKWEAAAAPAAAAGVRVVHPRIGIVFGKGGGALVELTRPFKLHAGGPLGSGRQWVSWIHERDAVGGLVLALTSQAMTGPYNFVAPRPVTAEEEAHAVAKALHTHALARVPGFALKVVLGSGRARAILTGQRASSARLAAAGHVFAYSDALPALQDVLG